MREKSRWLFELLIIIIIISVINQSVLFIGSNDFHSLISGFIINIIGLISLLIFAIFRINKENTNNIHSFYYYISIKTKSKDILVVLLLFILGKMAYIIMFKFEFVHLFDNSNFAHITYAYSDRTIFKTWSIISLIILIILVGVSAEELFFRSYLFEIQYNYFKDYTWIINGFSWSIYHLFSPTNFFAYLPTCLLYSYVYQKKRNVRITFLAHLINNFLAFYPVIKSYL